jgi:hypothetical protein
VEFVLLIVFTQHDANFKNKNKCYVCFRRKASSFKACKVAIRENLVSVTYLLSLKMDKQQAGENYKMRSFIICTMSIIRMLKSRNMRWVEHIELMRGKRNAYNILEGNLMGRPIC